MEDRSRPTTPFIYRLVRDRSGQSETIGVVVLLGITIIGTAGIVAFGSTAIQDTKEQTQLQRTEHTMTLFDSRAAMVALGSSESQQVSFTGSGDGEFRVNEDTGYMKIVHYNHSGGDNAEVIYNNSLGAFIYDRGGVEIAYQGGGVWRKDGNRTEMVSPPEFHYRGSTLTLPIIRTTGEMSTSGPGTITIESEETARRVFPNASLEGNPDIGAPYNDTDDSTSGDQPGPYINPVENGTVVAFVHSDYYKGWATFFKTRSEGDVKVYDSNKTVSIELVGGGEVGDFDMPADGNGFTVPGMPDDDHPINNFSIRIVPDGSDEANFNNLQWSMYIDEGNREMEFHLRDAGGGCGTDGGADLTVYFTTDGGSTYQGWHGDCVYEVQKGDVDGDSTDEYWLNADFTEKNKNLTYTSLSSSDLTHFNPGGSATLVDVEWDQHTSLALEPVNIGTSDRDTMDISNISNHYLTQFGSSYEVSIDDKGSDTVEESASSGTLDYPAEDINFITYLHISENEIEIDD